MSDVESTTLEEKSLEMATKGIEMAHSQIPLRVRMRDNVLLAYLAATGVIYGIVFKGKTPDNTEILLLIPFLTLGSTIIVSHHNILISALINFCAECSEEIRKIINPDEAGESEKYPDEAKGYGFFYYLNHLCDRLYRSCRLFLRILEHGIRNEKHSNKKKGYGFYCSSSFQKHLDRTLCLRTLGHAIILLVPAILALWVNFHCPPSLVWCFSLALTLFSLCIIVCIADLRMQEEQTHDFRKNGLFINKGGEHGRNQR